MINCSLSKVLKITLPPGNMIGSVMEMKGMSKITFIKNEKNEMVYQVFTHRGLGGFGWTTSAKVYMSAYVRIMYT